MLYNNNLCKLTVFKKYSNRSSTAALEWYLNNFLRGRGCWGGNFDFKVFIFSFSKNSNFTFFEKKIWRGGLTLIVVSVLQHFGHLSTAESDHSRLSQGKYTSEL